MIYDTKCQKQKTRPKARSVPKVGVEPTLPFENYALNVARLPIPPLRQEVVIF